VIFDLDHWREIGNALTANKLRTTLTAFGVFWGIFMLMLLLGSGRGLENGVTRGFDNEATNSFYVWSRATSKPFRGLPAGRRFSLDNDDHRAIVEHVPEAEVVAPRLQLGGYRSGDNVVRRDKTGSFSVMGDYPQIARVQRVALVAGRFLNPIDLADERKVAVIGTRVREILFAPEEDPLGGYLQVRGVYFQVVGVHRPTGDGEGREEQANTIYVPFTTAQRTFNFGREIGWFAITSRPDVRASVAEQRVLRLLRERHRIHPDDERALGHWNTEEEFRKVTGLFSGIRVLVWIVGIGTLAAGVIGVSNIMLVIVRERTQEIGVRRALGATPASVIAQIVLEAVLLTASAGYVGLIAGMALIDVVAARLPPGGSDVAFIDPAVDLRAALQALVVLVVAGVLAGVMPAQRAVAVRPVEALRAG